MHNWIGRLTLALTLAAPATATADQWWDPDLEDGIRLADLVVVGTTTGNDDPTSETRGWVSHASHMKVDRVIFKSGEGAEAVTPGAQLTWTRLSSHHGPKAPPPVGMQFLLFLQRKEGTWRMFTPSWLLRRVGSDTPIVQFPVRDPSAQIRVSLDDIEQWVRLWRKADRSPADAAPFVERLVQAAAKTEPGTKQLEDVEAQVLAAEVCYAFGTPKKSAALAPFLTSPYFHVRRCAARALGTCGGPDAITALTARLGPEDRDEVVSDIAHALFRLSAGGEAVVAALTSRLKTLGEPAENEPTTVGLRGNIMNPQLNCIPAPRYALTAALKRAEGAADSWEELTGWEGHPWRSLQRGASGPAAKPDPVPDYSKTRIAGVATAGGKPLAGHRIYLGEPRWSREWTTTDAEGRFQFNEAWGDQQVRAALDRNGEWMVQASPGTADVKLELPAPLRFPITLAGEGGPVVALFGLSRKHAQGFTLAPSPVDPGGKEEFLVLPPKSGALQPFQLWARAVDGRLASSPWIDASIKSGTAAVLDFGPALRTTCLIVDADGDPLEGAEVAVVMRGEPGLPLGLALIEEWDDFEFAVTGADGLVTIPAAAGCSYYVEVRKERAAGSALVAAGTTGTTIRVQPRTSSAAGGRYTSLHGVIRRADGTPISGAQVAMVGPEWPRGDPWRHHTVASTTAADGSFQSRMPRWGNAWTLIAATPRPQSPLVIGEAEIDGTQPEGDTKSELRFDVKLHPPRWCQRLEISVAGPNGPAAVQPITVRPFDHWQPARVTYTSNAKGRVVITPRRSSHYFVQVPWRNADGTSHPVFHTAAPGPDGRIAVTHAPGHSLTVAILDPDGEPTEGEDLELHLCRDGADPFTAVTLPLELPDDVAEFTVRGLPKGTYWLTGRWLSGDLRVGPVTIAGENTTVRHRIPKPTILRGRVVDAAGRPVAGAQFQLVHGCWDAGSTSMRGNGTNPDGFFESWDAHPGPVRVLAKVHDWNNPEREWMESEVLSIDLKPGEQRWVTLTVRK